MLGLARVLPEAKRPAAIAQITKGFQSNREEARAEV